MTEETNPTKDLKFYSQEAIGIATFIGGPLAAGYLIKENYKTLDEPQKGRNSLLIGIIATVLVFGGILMLPDHVADNIPRFVVPVVYMIIIHLIVEKIHGRILKTHKENDNDFFSRWQAVKIGFVSLVIIVVGFVGAAFLLTDDAMFDQYDEQIAKFSKNEAETLVFYEYMETKESDALIRELDDIIIPKWKENIRIIEGTYQLGKLPSDLVRQNEILTTYCKLRIEAFELLRKAIEDGTSRYSIEIDQVHMEIERQLDLLN